MSLRLIKNAGQHAGANDVEQAKRECNVETDEDSDCSRLAVQSPVVTAPLGRGTIVDVQVIAEVVVPFGYDGVVDGICQ